MNTVINYQPGPQALWGNNVQHCDLCEKERDNLQQVVCMAYSTAMCITGCCTLGCVTPAPKACLYSAAFTGACALRCLDKAESTVDKCLKERKCCHSDHLPYQSHASEWDNFGFGETDASEKPVVDIYPPTQFQVLTLQPGARSVRNRAAQGCLTPPRHSPGQGNGTGS